MQRLRPLISALAALLSRLSRAGLSPQAVPVPVRVVVRPRAGRLPGDHRPRYRPR